MSSATAVIPARLCCAGRPVVSEVPQDGQDRALPAARGDGLPWHVRFFARQSRKGLPAPRYAVTLERGVQIPMPDGTYQAADVYRPVTGEPCPTLLVRTPYGRGFPYDFMDGALFAVKARCPSDTQLTGSPTRSPSDSSHRDPAHAGSRP
jgi:hypothetical protein